MDYRVTAIRDAAVSQAAAATKSANDRRESTRGGRDVDTSAEILIARYQGRAEGYQWCADQLNTLDATVLPPAGGPEAPADESSGRGVHASNIRGCGTCTRNLELAVTKLDAMHREANAYGWNDSDTQRYYHQLKDAVSALASDLKSH